jgi:hypothetical protein
MYAAGLISGLSSLDGGDVESADREAIVKAVEAAESELCDRLASAK